MLKIKERLPQSFLEYLLIKPQLISFSFFSETCVNLLEAKQNLEEFYDPAYVSLRNWNTSP